MGGGPILAGVLGRVIVRHVQTSVFGVRDRVPGPHVLRPERIHLSLQGVTLAGHRVGSLGYGRRLGTCRLGGGTGDRRLNLP